MQKLLIKFLVIVFLFHSCASYQPRDHTQIHGIEVTTSLLPKKIRAATVYPFVFVNSDKPRTQALINHENIHLEQYKELLLIGFLVVYLYEYLHWRITTNYGYSDWAMALEQEAYQNENNDSYLDTRKAFAWWDY